MRWISGIRGGHCGEEQPRGGLWVAGISGGAITAGWLALGMVCIQGCGTAREQAAPERTAASTAPAMGQNTANVASEAAHERAPSAEVDAGADGGEGADGGAAEAVEPPKKRMGELARFYTALDGLAAGTRKDHVRVMWLGDSHGQADFWSGKLRSILQKRFGNGGPGFVHIAFGGYRHDGVEVFKKDKWATTPRGPSTSQVTGDGVLGLGGLLTSAKNPGSEAGVEVRDSSLAGKLHWDLCYRFAKPGDAIQVSLTGKKPLTLSAGNKLAANPPLQHMKLTTDTTPPAAAQAGAGGTSGTGTNGTGTNGTGTDGTGTNGAAAKDEAGGAKEQAAPKPRLTVSPTTGYPYFCGVVIETDPTEKPGVVLDILGINGARYTTALAWNEEAWMAELMRRSPDLVIFEYGTNESGDVGIKVETYEDRVARIVARIRKKKPDTDCAVLAPTERADQEERSARMRDILREAAKQNGCFFWDTIEAMGGKGAMRAWRDSSPPLGAKDGIHLTVKGYYELGEKLAADLMKKY